VCRPSGGPPSGSRLRPSCPAGPLGVPCDRPPVCDRTRCSSLRFDFRRAFGQTLDYDNAASRRSQDPPV
jgi:hypothetical protein